MGLAEMTHIESYHLPSPLIWRPVSLVSRGRTSRYGIRIGWLTGTVRILRGIMSSRRVKGGTGEATNVRILSTGSVKPVSRAYPPDQPFEILRARLMNSHGWYCFVIVRCQVTEQICVSNKSIRTSPRTEDTHLLYHALESQKYHSDCFLCPLPRNSNLGGG